ncbi:MAG TPA: sensor histidine kinase [Bacillales bacterium]|nr:sensor histidine kinase [Bacillales bacterium]
MSLRFKLLSGFFILIIIPLFLLGTVAFFVSQHMIEKKYSQLNEVTLKSVARNINTVTGKVNQLSVAAVANPTVQQILSLDTAQMTKAELKLHTIDAEQALRKILYTYPYVYSVMLYDVNGVSYKVGRYNSRVISYKELTSHQVFQEVVKRDGQPVWIGPYQYPKLTGKGSILTEIRMVKDVDSLQNTGVLILQTKLKGIGEIFHQVTPGNRFLIVNRDGLIFYDNLNHLQGRELALSVGEAIPLPSHYQTYKRTFNGKDSLISVYGLSLKHWRIVSVQSLRALSKEVLTIVKWITVITGVCVIGSLLFNILFVNRTAKSIINVVRLMKRVEEGDLQARAKVEGSGETRKLTLGFNSFVSRIRRLLHEVKMEQERKQKAEMMLLEAQIQPHFLFNTLESINALAVQNQGRKVSRMIHQLGQILRISIEEEQEIPIRLEVEHLKSYLAIQKYRFEEIFDYRIDIPVKLMDHIMLKLTLQPLVENALQHAFIGLERKGEIRVSASDAGDRVEFFIQDNGNGFSESALANLQVKDSEEMMDRKGLGIRNVADRLRIRYGQEYGLLICSSVGEGTIIKCVIPKDEWEDDHGTD